MISSVSANPITQPTQPVSLPGGTQSLLNPQTFLQLLVAQLQNQNPLSPTSNSQMLSETSQLSTMQVLQQLETQAASQASTSATLTSSTLIGRTVTATGANGTTVTGVVSGVQINSNGPLLQVGGAQVPLSAVQQIVGT